MDVAKREDRLLDKISELGHRRDKAVSFMRLWSLANPVDAELCRTVTSILVEEATK